METEQSKSQNPFPSEAEAPGQQAIKVMKTLIDSVPEGRERSYVVEACVQLCYRLWGWNVERFRDELALCSSKSALVQNTIDRSGPYVNPID